MKRKTKKVLSIIGLCLLIACGIAYIILYAIFPVKTQTITWDIFDYICNKPLPVVGVTTIVLAIFIYKLVIYIVRHKGTKISDLKGEIAQLKKELDESKEYAKKIEEDSKIEINKTNDFIKKLCYSIPNKKIKELGESKYGKQENVSCEETKDL